MYFRKNVKAICFDISDLTRHEDFTLVLDWSKWTHASKNGPPLYGIWEYYRTARKKKNICEHEH